MYTEDYNIEPNKINIDAILDNIDLETWDDDLFDVTIGEDDDLWELEDDEEI